MLLGGLQKTTLIDYPGKVACTVFTYGCNFRCEFCHNPGLVNEGGSGLDEEEFFRYLKKRSGLLEAVCITGGEPTFHGDIVEFCEKIKKLGYLIKLDTNGSNFMVLDRLLNEKLVDMVSMDIKTSFENYQGVVGRRINLESVKSCINRLCVSGVEYELRTTVVPTIHNVEVLKEMAKQIKGLAIRAGVNQEEVVWVLQKFRPGNCLDKKFDRLNGFSKKEEGEILSEVVKFLPRTRWR